MQIELSADQVKEALSQYLNEEHNRYGDIKKGLFYPKDILGVSQKYKTIPRAQPCDYVEVFDGLKIEIKE